VSDCGWDCGVCRYHHDHGYGYGPDCGSSGGNRDLDETFHMGGGTVRGSGNELMEFWSRLSGGRSGETRTGCGGFLWGNVSARDCGKEWIWI
jgi:hypothetical protein